MIDYTSPSEFNSVFKKYLLDYLCLKQAMGMKIISAGNMLRQFDRYCVKIGQNKASIDEQLANNWFASKQKDKAETRATRISALKCFKDYLNSIGIENTWQPISGYASRTSRYAPYIFTKKEITNIFNVADRLEKPFGKSMFHIIFPTVLKILYSTGMRISEVLNLQINDIDLENGIIFIRNAKFDKSRNLPISKSLLLIIKNYYAQNFMQISNSKNKYLFPNQYGEKYSQRTVYDKFRIVLWSAGIPHGGKGKGPRVHDFRHTFAVYSLSKLLKEEKDIYVALTFLMVYLGYSKVSSTEYYLRLTAESYPDFIEKSNDIAEKVIPEVTSYE